MVTILLKAVKTVDECINIHLESLLLNKIVWVNQKTSMILFPIITISGRWRIK